MSQPIIPVPGVLKINPYISGGVTPAKYTRKVGLASNESLLGPSPLVIKKIQESAALIYKYPNAANKKIGEAIAAFHHIDPTQVMCTCGSEEGLHLLVRVFAGPGDEVLFSQYAFQVYDIASKAVGATPVRAPAPRYVVDVDSLLSCVTSKTKIVMIDNPSNPVGGCLSREELLRLRRGLPDNVLLVIDSAYAEFLEKEDYSSGIDIVQQYDNVVMTRTFSKFYAMAGLRLGWLYAPKNIFDYVNRIRPPFSCSSLAQEAGVVALEDVQHQKKILNHNTQWLNWFTQQIDAMGFKYIPSAGNFLTIACPPEGPYNAEAVYDALAMQGYIVRPLKDYNMPYHLRISIGLEEDMRAVVSILEKFLQQNSLHYAIK